VPSQPSTPQNRLRACLECLRHVSLRRRWEVHMAPMDGSSHHGTTQLPQMLLTAAGRTSVFVAGMGCMHCTPELFRPLVPQAGSWSVNPIPCVHDRHTKPVCCTHGADSPPTRVSIPRTHILHCALWTVPKGKKTMHVAPCASYTGCSWATWCLSIRSWSRWDMTGTQALRGRIQPRWNIEGAGRTCTGGGWGGGGSMGTYWCEVPATRLAGNPWRLPPWRARATSTGAPHHRSDRPWHCWTGPNVTCEVCVSAAWMGGVGDGGGGLGVG
jgi:hypothetical protein